MNPSRMLQTALAIPHSREEVDYVIQRLAVTTDSLLSLLNFPPSTDGKLRGLPGSQDGGTSRQVVCQCEPINPQP